jgi:predicted O-methyltransferase YrrM
LRLSSSSPRFIRAATMMKKGEKPFDFIFIDTDKEGYLVYLDYSVRLARKGSLIVADNVARQGDVADRGNPDPRIEGMRAYIERASADTRLQTTVIQTVGVRGHDGFAISLVM